MMSCPALGVSRSSLKHWLREISLKLLNVLLKISQ